MQVEIVNPLALPDWDRLLLDSGIHSFFYSASWARVLSESYDYKPTYFAVRDHGTLSAVLPLMQVRTPLLARKGVSLPFTDFCHPAATNLGCLQQLMDAAISHGKSSKWRSIEFRGGSFSSMAPPFLSYYDHTLPLTEDNKQLFSRLSENTKRNINISSRKGVVVQVARSLESMKTFYDLHCATRKHHGLPPQPFYFFRKIYDHIIAPAKGRLFAASYTGKCVSAAIFLHFGNEAIFKYGASDRRYHNLRPNNLLMWEAIKCYANEGFATLDFGRTSFFNRGLRRYKRGWGTEERVINYYRYDCRTNAFVRGVEPTLHYPAFLKHVPLPLMKILGHLCYPLAG